VAIAVAIAAAGLTIALRARKRIHSSPSPAAKGEVLSSSPRQPNVVFVVVDMVRADRLSFCGYERPTTPNLDRFAGAKDAFATCRAYAPGTWTLSSHASYFTGEEVPVHGTDFVLQADGKSSVPLWGEPARPLAPEFETLAEVFQKRGYTTILVSGNPVVSRVAATGLDRGFEIVRDTAQFGRLYGEELVRAVDSALDEASGAEKPVFLFINIADAHHPWSAVPGGLPWMPAREALDNRPRFPDTPYPRFLRGDLVGEQKRQFLAHVVDSYDYAVWRADRTFGAVMTLLWHRGVFTGPSRAVVTSDHGELLGEHDLVGHGLFVYEGISRVPLFYRSKTGEPLPLDEEAPLSALTAYDLAAEGALPAKPREVRAAGYPDGMLVELFGAERFASAHAAAWSGAEKITWADRGYELVDLAKDPGEQTPLKLPSEHPGRTALERFVAQIRKTADRAVEPSKEMIEALRALGYVR